MNLSPPSSLSQPAISQTLTSIAQLANLLPTATLLALQLLPPSFTNNGSCDSATRPMTLFVLAFLALVCFLAYFTDSFKSADGQVFYGFTAMKGMWLFDYWTVGTTSIPDLSKYKPGFIDWIHAILSAFVLVALRDNNVVSCFYPKPTQGAQRVLDIVPITVGLICNFFVCVIFPTKKHGTGYPVTPGN